MVATPTFRCSVLSVALALVSLVAASTSRAQPYYPFVTFESGQVRPLALSPDGTRLFAVNTPDNQLEIYQVGVGTLTHEASVPVGLEPVAVAARSNTEVWVVNHLSDSISIVDLATPPHVARTLLVGDEPRDIVFAGPGGNRAFITTAHRGQNSPYQATIETVLETPGIGRADVWVFDATSLGASLGGTPLTIVTLFGDTPRALAVSPDGATVYAAIFHSGNRTTTLSEGVIPNGGESAGGLPEPNTNFQSNAQPETGLIVQYDGAAWRDELGRDWSSSVKFALPDKDVFSIDASANPPVALTGAANERTGVGTILFNMITNPVSGKIYVSNLESFNRVRFEGAGTYSAGFKPPGEPASVRGHIAESRITVLDGATVTPRHLNKHIDYSTCCAPLPNAENDTSLAFPIGMAISSDGSTLYVAALGSSKIGVYDTATLEDDSFVPSTANQITVTGGGPTGLMLDEANSQLFVLTRFDDGISVVSTATGNQLAHVKMHNPEPGVVVQGRPFLYDARNASSHGDSACASCHIFGDFDSLAWDLGDPDGVKTTNNGPFTVVVGDAGFNPMKGPMTTQSLRGMDNHGPMHWRGDRRGGPINNQPNQGAFDEHAAFTAFNPAFVGLLGRSVQLSNTDMDKFTAFILEVMYPPNPVRNLDDSLTTAQQAGHDFYFNQQSDTLFTCNGCHVLDPLGNESFFPADVARPGFFGSDGRYSFENEPQHLKIPHLRNMYQKVGMFGMPAVPFFNAGDNGFMGDQVRGFGFLHDGSVDTLFRFHNASVFNQTGGNPGGFEGGAPGDQERRDVEAFMFAFDSNLKPMVGQQITRTSTSGAAVDARIDLMLANLSGCDLIAKGVIDGEPRGAYYFGGMFHLDRSSDPPLTLAAFRALADVPGQDLTFSCVPRGEGIRIGIDRDNDGSYDRDELDDGSDPANPSSGPCGGSGGCDKCRRAIAKGSARHTQDLAKAYSACELGKLKGTLPPATDCIGAPDGGTAAKLVKADSAFAATVSKACNGTSATRTQLGFPSVCPDFESSGIPACTATLISWASIPGCLTCINTQAVRQAMSLYYDAFVSAGPASDVGACQQAIGKETNAFLAAKSKALAKCRDKRLNRKHHGECPDASAPVGSASRKAADAIAKAEAKRLAKTCKACGGADGSCDGVNDLAPAAIGFAATCPNVTVPGGSSCAATISTMQDVVTCVGCVTEFKEDCMDTVSVPAVASYPAECNP